MATSSRRSSVKNSYMTERPTVIVKLADVRENGIDLTCFNAKHWCVGNRPRFIRATRNFHFTKDPKCLAKCSQGYVMVVRAKPAEFDMEGIDMSGHKSTKLYVHVEEGRNGKWNVRMVWENYLLNYEKKRNVYTPQYASLDECFCVVHKALLHSPYVKHFVYAFQRESGRHGPQWYNVECIRGQGEIIAPAVMSDLDDFVNDDEVDVCVDDDDEEFEISESEQSSYEEVIPAKKRKRTTETRSSAKKRRKTLLQESAVTDTHAAMESVHKIQTNLVSNQTVSECERLTDVLKNGGSAIVIYNRTKDVLTTNAIMFNSPLRFSQDVGMAVVKLGDDTKIIFE